MTELEHYIHSYFGIERDSLERVVGMFRQTELAKGGYFLKAGKHCDKLSFIKAGLIRVYVETDEKEVTQWISNKGYFVTELSSLIFGTPSRWNFQALADSELYTINKEDYNRIGTIVPQWHELEKLFIAKCFTILEDRIFSHLSMTAEERYQFFFERNKELFNLVPHQYIASMLGMTPETFSRIRKKQLG